MEPEELREHLARNIRDLVSKRGISLNALATTCGISRGALHYILSCQVGTTVDMIAKIAEGLSVEPATLLKARHR